MSVGEPPTAEEMGAAVSQIRSGGGELPAHPTSSSSLRPSSPASLIASISSWISRSPVAVAEEPPEECKHEADVTWAATHGIRTVQTALVEARAIMAQQRTQMEAEAAAEDAAAAEAEHAAVKRNKPWARSHAPSPLDAGAPERRATVAAAEAVAEGSDHGDAGTGTTLALAPPLGDFRALCDVPVLGGMSHAATQVGTLPMKDLVESASIHQDVLGDEWVYYEGYKCTGWMCLLATDGRTLQLGQDHFRKRRQAARKMKKGLLARSGTSFALTGTRDVADANALARKKEAQRDAGEDEDVADGEAHCILMTGDGQTFRRNPEIGEWYVETGQATVLKGWNNYFKLSLDVHFAPNGAPVYVIPEPEPEPEPEIDLGMYMRQNSGKAGTKFSLSNSGIAQHEATEAVVLAGGPAARSTEDVVHDAIDMGWWGCDLVPGTTTHDNGCSNIRGIQEATLKQVNAKAGDVILEVGFFLGEAMAKTATTLATASKACRLIEPSRERIKEAEDKVNACGLALKTAKINGDAAAAEAVRTAKAAAAEAAEKAEEERLKREAQEAKMEGAGAMETLRILAEEAEAAEEAAAEGLANRCFEYPEHVNHVVERTVAEIASDAASVSADAGHVCSMAAAEMCKAAEDLDRLSIGGGGAGVIHGCDLEGRVESLRDWLSEELPAEAANAAQCCAADVAGGLNSLPFPGQIFDKAYVIGALSFWPDLPVALQELRRVLDPQGVLVLALQCSLLAAGQWKAHLPNGVVWSELEIRQALREAGFGIEGSHSMMRAKRFTLDDETNARDMDAAMRQEKIERLELTQQQQRAANERNLKVVPDCTIEYVGFACYRTVYCTACKVSISSGRSLYQPAERSDTEPNAEADQQAQRRLQHSQTVGYGLAFGPTSCECLLTILNDADIDALQLDVSHPFGAEGDMVVTHTFNKQNFPPVDLENHHTPPVHDFRFLQENTENMIKTLSSNKRAMHVTVKAYAAELDYKGEVTTRSVLGSGFVDLGLLILNLDTRGERPDKYAFEVAVQGTDASQGPVAKVVVEFRGDAQAWCAAFMRRLRTIYFPGHEEVNICRDCYRMTTVFASQTAAIAARWKTKHAELEEITAKTEENKGSQGVALDHVILVAGQLDGRFSAARAMDDADLLSSNFMRAGVTAALP